MGWDTSDELVFPGSYADPCVALCGGLTRRVTGSQLFNSGAATSLWPHRVRLRDENEEIAMMEDVLDSANVDEALQRIPGWRHSGEFLVRVVPVNDSNKQNVQNRVAQVETDPERCSFTDTEAGLLIYLGDVGGEGISEHDLNTAAKIESVLADVM
jgi:hypothetical protein